MARTIKDPPKHLDPKDGGIASRKLWYAIGTSIVIMGGWIATVRYPLLNGSFPTLIGGLLGALGIYCGVNVANTFAIGSNLSKVRVGDQANYPTYPSYPTYEQPEGYIAPIPMLPTPPPLQQD